MFEMLDGKGTELGIINAVGWAIFLLAKAGAFRKMRIWIKIGGNGLTTGSFKPPKPKNPNNPGHPCMAHTNAIGNLQTEITNMKKSHEESCKNNREDHKEIYNKIEEIRVKIGA